MKKIVLSLALASSLLFAANDHSVEMMATIGGVKPEGNLDLKNQLNFGLRFGTFVEDKFFDMIEFGIERVNSADYKNSTSDTSINRFFVDLIKEYPITEATSWYGLAGVGYENIRTPLFANDDDSFVQYGIGLKHWINENFALKAEARHGITFEGNNNLFYTLSFVIPFGEKKQPIQAQPVVQPQPAPAPAPVFVPAPVVDDDIDKDGVPNALDKCPNSPKNQIVNQDGCMKVIRLHVNFDYDSAKVQTQELKKIYEVIEFMIANPDFSVTLDGHTDAKGSQKYNQALGLKRANAMAKLLESKGISAAKITTNSYGEDNPVASNDDEAGRAMNRRVDAHFDK
ncbi:MAG: OmpA family protein [Sulfurospirillum sp.]|nr:OmpA family protein [Sulfurospirillum sp.]